MRRGEFEARTAGEFEFTLVDGLVSLHSGPVTRYELGCLRDQNPDAARWELEAFVNHNHPALGELPRESMRTAARYARNLAAALREAFPDKGFVISNWLGMDNVTFYQRGDGAPEADDGPEEPAPDELSCLRCGSPQRYRVRAEPDPEFPKVEWGDCVACGGELFVSAGDERTCVGPAAAEGVVHGRSR